MNQFESPEIQALKERYRASFTEKAEQLNAHLIAVKHELNPQVRNETHQTLHKLAGSSGMYDYNDISLQCRDAIDQIDIANSGVMAENLIRIIALLEQHR